MEIMTQYTLCSSLAVFSGAVDLPCRSAPVDR